MQALPRGFMALALLCVILCLGTVIVLLPAITSMYNLHTGLEFTSVILSSTIKIGIFAIILAGVSHTIGERNENTYTA